MKVINAKDYKYIGTSGIYHMFQSTKTDWDDEIVCVTRARFITKEGKSIFFDPIVTYVNNENLKLPSTANM